MGQKRKRIALSCVDCRRRKVKCDRTYPICIRCQKGDNADNCTYVPHTGSEPGLPTPSDDSPQQHHALQSQVAPSSAPHVLATIRDMSPHMEVQSRMPSHPSPTLRQPDDNVLMKALYGRAAQLETHARSAGSKPISVGFFAGQQQNLRNEYSEPPNTFPEASKVMVRGKNFSTHYYGPSFAISMLLQFEELSKFVKGMLGEGPALVGMKEKMSAFRAASNEPEAKSTSSNLLPTIDMIPEREIVDKLVQQYLDTFETTYRVLHVPIFLRQYDAYWQNPAEAKTEFIVVLLLIMSCVYCVVLVGPPGYVGRSSACREVASRWIAACETWLEEQSQKHVTLAYFQAHTLVFIARAMLCIKVKREWTASGHLLRLAMSVGMHREPSLLSKRISAFDQEMRRRLWYTILEIDLLTTISRGMPPTIDSFSWDCLPPRNIDDEDFNEESEQLPPSKDRSSFTRTSFLHITNESLALRVEVLGRVNSVRLGLDLDAVLQYDNKLRALIESLPVWKSSMHTSFAQHLSSLVLYDFILILHIPFASHTQNRPKLFYSVASKRDISYKTLQLYASIPEIERLTLMYIRDDAARALLAISHDMASNSENDVLPNYDKTLSFMDTVVESEGKRFQLLGRGFHTFWITLSAYHFLKWKVSRSSTSITFAQDAASRVSALFQQILESQTSMPLLNGDASDVEVADPASVPPTSDSLEAFEAAFPEFELMNFFDDPFSDMNFDLATAVNTNSYSI